MSIKNPDDWAERFVMWGVKVKPNGRKNILLVQPLKSILVGAVMFGIVFLFFTLFPDGKDPMFLRWIMAIFSGGLSFWVSCAALFISLPNPD